MKRFAYFLVVLALACSCAHNPYRSDVVVYGGTSAAVSAAVQVSRMGKSVVLVSPDKHLGGLSSSGLGYTDTGNKEVIGGIAREFYGLIYDHYAKDEAWKWQSRSEYGGKGQGNPAVDGTKRTQWIFEPHVAEEAFETLLKGEKNITVLREERLDRGSGVTMRDGKIASIRTLSGKVFKAKVYIDATYEGDLMAAAGVEYTIGREGNDVYGEFHNGVQSQRHDHGHYFMYKVDPYVVPGDPSSGLLFGISDGQPGPDGSGDDKIQAYNFRLCLTKVDENRLPFYAPDDYDPSRYELL
ncbi:MAG: FAD-dependent oxidoreductase, partial [Bacteroidales bacterium]|nr:FAD-dependent oxidoreductase [Bacteroidales bacterium]